VFDLIGCVQESPSAGDAFETSTEIKDVCVLDGFAVSDVVSFVAFGIAQVGRAQIFQKCTVPVTLQKLRRLRAAKQSTGLTFETSMHQTLGSDFW